MFSSVIARAAMLSPVGRARRTGRGQPLRFAFGAEARGEVVKAGQFCERRGHFARGGGLGMSLVKDRTVRQAHIGGLDLPRDVGGRVFALRGQ